MPDPFASPCRDAGEAVRRIGSMIDSASLYDDVTVTQGDECVILEYRGDDDIMEETISTTMSSYERAARPFPVNAITK